MIQSKFTFRHEEPNNCKKQVVMLDQVVSNRRNREYLHRQRCYGKGVIMVIIDELFHQFSVIPSKHLQYTAVYLLRIYQLRPNSTVD